MKAAKLIFWSALAGLLHTHVTYPLTLAALARLRRGRVSPPAPSRSAGPPGNGRPGADRADGADGAPADPANRADAAGRGQRGRGDAPPPSDGDPPSVTLIVAAYDEEEVIAAKVANALALDYPRERLEIVIASDGSSDRTCEIAREAGADRVLELPRGGKMATQNAAVALTDGELVAFSDANSAWEPGALRALAAAFADPTVGYAAGEVRFLDPDGDNEEGAYWRYETRVRELESELGGITAGNGGIYAVRRAAYRALGPSRSHDLSFPFELRKRGWRSLHVPAARASERMVPSIEGEFARKRRMMVGLPDIVIADRMWDPRGYGPLYAFQVLSHRVLRYASPLLHVAALAANLAILLRGRRGASKRGGPGASPPGSPGAPVASVLSSPGVSGPAPIARPGRIYGLALAAQMALLGLAAAGSRLPGPAGRIGSLARYYVLVTASIALGAWDRWRNGPPAAWEKSEGTR